MTCPKCESNRVMPSSIKECYDCLECGLNFDKYNLLNGYYKFLNKSNKQTNQTIL